MLNQTSDSVAELGESAEASFLHEVPSFLQVFRKVSHSHYLYPMEDRMNSSWAQLFYTPLKRVSHNRRHFEVQKCSV